MLGAAPSDVCWFINAIHPYISIVMKLQCKQCSLRLLSYNRFRHKISLTCLPCLPVSMWALLWVCLEFCPLGQRRLRNPMKKMSAVAKPIHSQALDTWQILPILGTLQISRRCGEKQPHSLQRNSAHARFARLPWGSGASLCSSSWQRLDTIWKVQNTPIRSADNPTCFCKWIQYFEEN